MNEQIERSRLLHDKIQSVRVTDPDQPDSIRFNLLLEQIGLKAICRTDQQEHLYEMIRKIIKPEGDVQVPEGLGGLKVARIRAAVPGGKTRKIQLQINNLKF